MDQPLKSPGVRALEDAFHRLVELSAPRIWVTASATTAVKMK